MDLPPDYRERVYAGWLGKCIGVRLGAPVETWTHDTIARHLGEVTDFAPLPAGKVFKPDDDTAYPLVMIRALEDFGPEASADQMGETILNYLGDGRGTICWGGDWNVHGTHRVSQSRSRHLFSRIRVDRQERPDIGGAMRRPDLLRHLGVDRPKQSHTRA